MKVIILSQYDAEKYCNLRHVKKSVMISISSTYMKDAQVYCDSNNNIVDILRLKFNDTESTDENYHGITKEQGTQIAEFVRKYENTETEFLVIHCFAGESRSAGVAAAICEYFSGCDIKKDDRYMPNMLCYKVVHDAICNSSA